MIANQRGLCQNKSQHFCKQVVFFFSFQNVECIRVLMGVNVLYQYWYLLYISIQNCTEFLMTTVKEDLFRVSVAKIKLLQKFIALIN